ncbi:hypothetical protein J4465_00300 [Candidatus Pacearchaeota archaeon]|nr:hypothetical protein [Candidatus Pacearchaeota archaeon]
MIDKKEERQQVLLMQIEMGSRVAKKLEKEHEILGNVLYDSCEQQINILGLKLKYIDLDSLLLTEKEIIVGENEIPIYKCDQMSNYDELFKRFGQKANSKLYNQLKKVESLFQKKLSQLEKDVKEYEQISGMKYSGNI